MMGAHTLQATLKLLFLGSIIICLWIVNHSIVSRDMTLAGPRAHQERAGYANALSCPLEPLGSQNSRNVVSGSPVIWLIASNNKQFRDIWRRHLLPRMRDFNFDAIFLIEESKRTIDDTLEQAYNGDIAFLKVPPYDDELTGFYFRAIKGYEWGLHHPGKKYEWFIRPDMDAYYCLHHIRLELNELEQKLHRLKPGIQLGTFLWRRSWGATWHTSFRCSRSIQSLCRGGGTQVCGQDFAR